MRLLLAERMAISLPEKKPFPNSKKKIAATRKPASVMGSPMLTELPGALAGGRFSGRAAWPGSALREREEAVLVRPLRLW
jgi:hypothetical protein